MKKIIGYLLFGWPLVLTGGVVVCVCVISVEVLFVALTLSGVMVVAVSMHYGLDLIEQAKRKGKK